MEILERPDPTPDEIEMTEMRPGDHVRVVYELPVFDGGTMMMDAEFTGSSHGYVFFRGPRDVGYKIHRSEVVRVERAS